jgi:hypothetical protein
MFDLGDSELILLEGLNHLGPIMEPELLLSFTTADR